MAGKKKGTKKTKKSEPEETLPTYVEPAEETQADRLEARRKRLAERRERLAKIRGIKK